MHRSFAFFALLAGCAGVGFPGAEVPAGSRGTRPAAPDVRVAEVRFVDAPSAQELAAHYCAEVAPPLLCRVFGAQPRDMKFVFDVELEIANRNVVELPVVSALVAFDAFPDTAATHLGTACVSLCEDPSNCVADANACQSDEPQIRDLDDFARATADFLVAVGQGERSLQDLRVRRVGPQDRIRMVLRLELSTSQMVTLIRETLRDAMAQLRQGRVPEFAIPYRIEGSVWVAVESFGRFAAGFGPVEGTWELTRTRDAQRR
ncbi:MAG: hypothetical protein AAGE52_26575 [Myxococcota bacterium]